MRHLLTGLASCWLSAVALGSTDSVTLKLSSSTSPAPSTVRVTIQKRTVSAAVPALASATVKRNAIEAALLGAGYPVVDDGPAGSSLTIHGLTTSERVSFETGDGGEIQDSLRHSTCGHSTVGFAAYFAPFDANLQPAIFTAGIVTDVGTLQTQVSASELSFQTDGPIICQALFQRLAPRAPQYGAQINYAGDRLEVYFDPAYTVTQGGIIFGTTSQTPGCSGTVESDALRRTLELRVGGTTNPGPDLFRIQVQGQDRQTIDVPVPPQTPPPALRSILLDGLQSGGVPAFAAPDPATLRIVDLGPMCGVTVRPFGTGEGPVWLSGPAVARARAAFVGPFDPFDRAALPAVFTAGIVTDVGVLQEHVTAAELSFQTDGPIICQALFQRLAPRAPQYGAQIDYAGDRLEIYFDPAYTVTQGGIIFGTTSPSQGSAGTVLFSDKKKVK